jgi:hypothetical protein
VPTRPRPRCSRREGEQFRAVVVDHTDKGMAVQLVEVPVLARVTGERAALGDEITARLESADVTAGVVVFVRT